MSSNADIPANLVDSLRAVLIDLCEHPYPFVVNPPTTPKRASVALILRVSPDYAHWPPGRHLESEASKTKDPKEQLVAFFAQDWVKHGEPEVLFIKRSSRKGDKWSSHVALPGGRRDPEDDDDRAAAVRETEEEVGIDLTEDNAIAAGNLAQRIVTTSWGKTALMVLCPYVFVLKKHDQPPLRLQPAEVASAHWVSLRALLSPTQRTVESIDVANRYGEGLWRWHSHFLLGKMTFAAVRLIPSQSVYSTAQAGFIPSKPENASAISKFRAWMDDKPVPAPSTDLPLHLWGLTLGVMADFLDLLPPHDAIRFWIYPTFTAYDLQFILWALSYRFRRRKSRLLKQATANPGSPIKLEDAQEAPMRNASFVNASAPEGGAPSTAEVGIEGSEIGKSRNNGRAVQQLNGSRTNAVEALLEGYYDHVKTSIKVALLSRAAVVGAIAFWIWRKNRRG